MARNFPSATRRRLVTAIAVCSMTAGFAAFPVASADDLKDRKERVQGEIKKAQRHLDQSSGRLVRTTKALQAAEARLDVAERELATARGQLAAAEVVDRQMQAALDAAERQLERAQADLVSGIAEVREQRDVLGQIALQSYQNGGPEMLGLSMVLTSKDPAELTSQLSSVDSVLAKESVTLSRLKAAKVLLVVQERRVEEAKEEVEERREAAAENLERKQVLEAQAEAAEQRVSQLVQERERARQAAAQAKAADAKRLRELQQERARISRLLKKRAQEARERARRRAAAQAKQEQSNQHQGSPAGYLSYPVQTYITSQYGMRLHPIYHQWRLHDGTDFGAACGTPIRAAANGRVIARYYNAGYGNRVIIDNGYHAGAGVATAYNHLSRYSTYVGEWVSRGEIIGYVGTTGYSTGCHLHFMVFRNGRTVDPMNWL